MRAGLGGSIQYRTWQAVGWLARVLPPRATYVVAAIAGTATYYAWPRARKAMQRNYRHVLPEASSGEIARIARRSLVNYCCYLADFVRFPSLSPQLLSASVGGDESFHALDGALERGKGAVIVCMHFGNWDLGAGAAAARGYPLTVVAETFTDKRLDDMVAGARTRLGMTIVKMEKAGPSLVRSLHKNGLLALLIDRPVPGDGVKVQFFGEEVEVPAGPARLALRTGAMVVPTAFPRVQPKKMDVTTLTDFGIDYATAGDEQGDVRALTQKIMNAHERFILQYPDQWYMFREMWPQQRQANGKPA